MNAVLVQWFAWRAVAPPPPPPRDLQEAMLAGLDGCDGLEVRRLRLRIRACSDARALWHQRGPLMQVLAAAGGEAFARRHFAQIDAAFRACWPAAPVSRPAPLG